MQNYAASMTSYERARRDGWICTGPYARRRPTIRWGGAKATPGSPNETSGEHFRSLGAGRDDPATSTCRESGWVVQDPSGASRGRDDTNSTSRNAKKYMQ